MLLNSSLRLQQMSDRSPPNIHTAYIEVCIAILLQSTVKEILKYSNFFVLSFIFSYLSSFLQSCSVLIPFFLFPFSSNLYFHLQLVFCPNIIILLQHFYLLQPLLTLFLCDLICFENGRCVTLLLQTKLFFYLTIIDTGCLIEFQNFIFKRDLC